MHPTDNLPSRSFRASRGASVHRKSAFATTVLFTAVLAACGGGGGNEAGSVGEVGTQTPDGQTAALKVAGVAAVGAALSGANITAQCATGSGTATAGNDGSYEVSVSGGTLPCVLAAVSGATTLHSVAAGSGNGTATANITPLTELVVAHLAGQDPAAFFASLTGSGTALSSVVTGDAVTSASTAVIATLRDAGVDVAALGDLVAGELEANTGAGYDGVLDRLAATLAQTGASMGTLTSAVAAASPAAAASASSSGSASSASAGEASTSGMLPASLLLRAKAPDCDALRSGNYRIIVVKPATLSGSSERVATTELASLDVTTMAGPTWTWEDGSQESMTPVAGERCHYAGATGNYDFLFAPSGVGFARSKQTGDDQHPDPNYRLVIALPEQTIPVSGLAGKWNTMGWERSDIGSFLADPSVITIGGDGRVTATCVTGTAATPESACGEIEGPYVGFVANSKGGYDVNFGPADDPHNLRAFAFEGGNGMKLVVMTHDDGSVHILTPHRSSAPQPVGSKWKAWNLQVDTNEVAADALSGNGFEVTAADATAGTLTRTVTALATGISHSQTLQGNTARTGWAYRAGGTATGSNGSPVTVREMYVLTSGLGFSTFWLPPEERRDTVLAAIDHGAAGFIPKTADSAVFCNALATVLDGRVYLPALPAARGGLAHAGDGGGRAAGPAAGRLRQTSGRRPRFACRRCDHECWLPASGAGAFSLSAASSASVRKGLCSTGTPLRSSLTSSAGSVLPVITSARIAGQRRR